MTKTDPAVCFDGMDRPPVVWDEPATACDGCGCIVSFTNWAYNNQAAALATGRPNDDTNAEDDDTDEENDDDYTWWRACLELPGRPYSRACPTFSHRWYVCAQCPTADFCGACVGKHVHPCTPGPVHGEHDCCPLCGTVDMVEELQERWAHPVPPARPHPDHPGPEPESYVRFYKNEEEPIYDSCDDDSKSSDDERAYRIWYPGPYKDEFGCQRRPSWTRNKEVPARLRRWSGDRLAWITAVATVARAPQFIELESSRLQVLADDSDGPQLPEV